MRKKTLEKYLEMVLDIGGEVQDKYSTVDGARIRKVSISKGRVILWEITVRNGAIRDPKKVR